MVLFVFFLIGLVLSILAGYRVEIATHNKDIGAAVTFSLDVIVMMSYAIANEIRRKR